MTFNQVVRGSSPRWLIKKSVKSRVSEVLRFSYILSNYNRLKIKLSVFDLDAFRKVARLVDELGSVVILKNNAPRYLVIDFSKADDSAVAKDGEVLEISKRLLEQNKEAYEELAK